MKHTIATTNAPGAIGPYVQAVEIPFSGTEKFLYLSGQLGLHPQTGTLPDGIEAQTRQAMENIGAILAASGLVFGDIVKTTIFLKDLADFSTVNTIYGSFFPENPPARSCVQVAALPKGGLVEIETVAVK